MTTEHDALRDAYAQAVYEGAPYLDEGGGLLAFDRLSAHNALSYLRVADKLLALMPQHAAAVLSVLGTVLPTTLYCTGCEAIMRRYEDGMRFEGSEGWFHYHAPGHKFEVVPVPFIPPVSLGAAAKEADDE